MPRRTPALVALLAALLAAPLHAQPRDSTPNVRGFQFGIDPITYASLTSDGITGGRSVGGGGLSLRFGWGFNDRLSLVMDVGVTDLAVADTAIYFLSHGDVLLRWTFFSRHTSVGIWEQFVHAGFGLRDVDAEDASPTGTAIYNFAGEVLTIGGGTSLNLSERLAFFAAGYWSTGDFNDERIGNVTTHNRGVAGVSSRVSLGLTFRRARRGAAPVITP